MQLDFARLSNPCKNAGDVGDKGGCQHSRGFEASPLVRESGGRRGQAALMPTQQQAKGWCLSPLSPFDKNTWGRLKPSIHSAVPAVPEEKRIAEENDAVRAESAAAGSAVARGKGGTLELSGRDERRILAWLDHIGETAPATIGVVVGRCRSDPEAQSYYLNRAQEAEGGGVADDRRFCSECTNEFGGVCSIARPGGVVSARRGYRPVALKHRCEAFEERQHVTVVDPKKYEEDAYWR